MGEKVTSSPDGAVAPLVTPGGNFGRWPSCTQDFITARTKILVLCYMFRADSLTIKAQLNLLLHGISDPRHYCHHVVVDESSHGEKSFHFEIYWLTSTLHAMDGDKSGPELSQDGVSLRFFFTDKTCL